MPSGLPSGARRSLKDKERSNLAVLMATGSSLATKAPDLELLVGPAKELQHPLSASRGQVPGAVTRVPGAP